VWAAVGPLLQDEDISLTLPQLLGTPRGIATLIAEAVSLATMAPFIVIEMGSLQAYAGGWLSLWNLLDVLTYGLQVWLCADTQGGVSVCVCLHRGGVPCMYAGWVLGRRGSALVRFQAVSTQGVAFAACSRSNPCVAVDRALACLQIAIAVMHLGRLYLASGWLSVLVAFQCVLLWFRLNYFSRCVRCQHQQHSMPCLLKQAGRLQSTAIHHPAWMCDLCLFLCVHPQSVWWQQQLQHHRVHAAGCG
jgi:hypothetical protein